MRRTEESMPPTRVALIGCGNHSLKYHAPALAHLAGQYPELLELTAICDLDLSRVQRAHATFGFQSTFTDLEELLAREALDACISVMPITAIVPVATRLLERGMPCLIEKPLAPSLAEARALAATAAATGTLHMVSVNRRFNPELVRAAAWIRERGPILGVRGAMLRARRREADFLWGTGLHLIDAVAALASPIVLRHCRAFGPDERWFTISAELGGGIDAQLDVLPTCGRTDEVYEIFGDGCVAVVSLHPVRNNRLCCYEGGEPVVEENTEPDTPRWLADGTLAETRAFLEAVRNGTPHHAGIADVLPSLVLCDQVAKETGR